MADENKTEDVQEDVVEDIKEDINEGDTSVDDTTNDDAAEEVEEVEEDIPVRKNSKDWRAEYFKEKQKKESDPNDVRAIIREELAPLRNSVQETADEKELREAMAKYPDAKGLEPKVRKYMSAEAYRNVPVDFIIRALISDSSAKKAAADEKAKGTRQGGHTRREGEAKLPDFSKMSSEEFAKWERAHNR